MIRKSDFTKPKSNKSFQLPFILCETELLGFLVVNCRNTVAVQTPLKNLSDIQDGFRF